MLNNVLVASTCLKLLLFEAYYSTDLEVHRNWLAITAKLPIDQWYTDTTSIWTLDYPPFFAYFEWLLARLAPSWAINDGLLDLVPQGQFGKPTIFYQRLTVIVSELVLCLTLQYYIKLQCSRDKSVNRSHQLAASIFLSPGLLIIDHIHFQYNGFLYGLLILSLIVIPTRPILSGFLFSTLLCFKHIYLYLAPAYFVYLLRRVCLTSSFKVNVRDSFKLGVAVITPMLLAFGPFLLMHHQATQLLSRLFPFLRGLTHAYWAPNVWALYSFTDKVASLVFPSAQPVIGGTRGIVGDVKFSMLPEVTPRITFILTLFYQVFALVPLFLWPTASRFLASVTLCGFASFLFGWHVHEKAVLMVIFPFSLIALEDRRLLVAFIPLTVAGYFSLMPLIYTSGETLLKYLYTVAWFGIFHLTFPLLVRVKRSPAKRVFLLDRALIVYTAAFSILLPVGYAIPLIAPAYEFVPLMMISVYCAVGILGSYAGLSWLYFFDDALWL